MAAAGFSDKAGLESLTEDAAVMDDKADEYLQGARKDRDSQLGWGCRRGQR